MGLDPVKNFAVVEVSTGYDDDDTSIVLASGHGARLPAPATDGAFNLVWWNYDDYKDPTDDPNREIVRVTARSTDTLTITRAQEGTSASTKNTSGKTYRMALVLTAKTITDLDVAHITAYEALIEGNLLKIISDGGTAKLAKLLGLSDDTSVSGSSNVIASKVVKLDTDKVLMVTKNNSSGRLECKAGTISGKVITWGTTVAITGQSDSPSSDGWDVAQTDTNQAVVVQSGSTSFHAKVYAISVSGTTVTVGAGVELTSGTSPQQTAHSCAVVGIGASKFLAVSWDRDSTTYFTRARSGTISGTTITLNSGGQLDVRSNATTIPKRMLIEKLDANKALVAFSVSTTWYFYVVSDSSGTLSKGAEASQSAIADVSDGADLVQIDTNEVWLVEATATEFKMTPMSVSSTTITVRSATTSASTLTSGNTQTPSLIYDKGVLNIYNHINKKVSRWSVVPATYVPYLLRVYTITFTSDSNSSVDRHMMCVSSPGKLVIVGGGSNTAYYKVGYFDWEMFVGVCDGTYSAGAPASVAFSKDIVAGFTNLTIGEVVYIGSSGVASHIPADTSLTIRIGIAKSSTTVMVD